MTAKKSPTGRDPSEVERRVRELEREGRETQPERHADPPTLLERRGEARKRPQPRRTFERLPGGGLLFDDVLPEPAPREVEPEFIGYDGWEGFGRSL